MKTRPIKLQLYTKSDCPLCDEAKDALRQVKAQFPIQVEETDITADLGLFIKYKNLIPVLEMEGRRLFVHHIDTRQLRRQLRWTQLRTLIRL
jgi:glutaredoxin